MRLSATKAAFVAAFFISLPALALDRAAVDKLVNGEGDERIQAIAALLAEGDPKAADLLRSAAGGEVELDGKKVEVMVNNRLRKEIAGALSAFRLLSADRAERLEAAKQLATGAGEAVLPLVKKALAAERDAEIKATLEVIAASMELKTGSPEARIAAIRRLADSPSPNTRTLLMQVTADENEDIRREAQKSLRAVDSRLAWGEWLGVAFTSVSLGSILLLAALGLAITYGLMGVINMAHGELIMIGAYTTYAV
ncbi:MAG: urea transport system permease protein, partial [Betaproteobacteria bacterium]|nr:urea transport system permease protein [Betaproteobacteria bacterium]